MLGVTCSVFGNELVQNGNVAEATRNGARTASWATSGVPASPIPPGLNASMVGILTHAQPLRCP